MSRLSESAALLWVAMVPCWAVGACSSPSSPAGPATGGAASGGVVGSAGLAGLALSGAAVAGEHGGGPNAGAGGTLAGGAGITSCGASGSGATSSGASGGGGASSGASGSGGASSGGGNGQAGTSGGSNANTVHVFLLAGQSNATGQGYTKNYPAGFAVDPRVLLYHSPEITSATGGDVWGPLRHASEAADGCGDRFGPELGFGNEVQALYPGRRIALIKHAKSATNLVSQWAPGSSPADTAHFGPELKTFVATVDSGIQALKAQGLDPKIVGMLWQQGEADADLGGTASADYGQNLSALIARAREQWSVPDMLFVYGFVYPKSNYGTGRDQVRAAEAKVDQDSGDPLAVHNAFVVDTDDLELRASDPNTCYPNDLIHFGSAGQLELGKRFAVKVHEHLALP